MAVETNKRSVRLGVMERIFLAVISRAASCFPAIGLASLPISYDDPTQRLPLILRVVPS